MSDQQPQLDLTNIPVDKIYVGGKWVDAHGGRMIEMVSPDTEKVVARVAEASEKDVDLAVAAAREAFDKGRWPRMAVKERTEWVRKLSAAIVARSEQMAVCWTYQIGMPYNMAKMFAPYLTNAMDQYIDIAENMDFVEQREIMGEGVGLLAYEPVGVVAAIAPWNVPINTMLNKVGPALVAGCTVIMKPAPETPLEAYIMARCADEIGLHDARWNWVESHLPSFSMITILMWLPRKWSTAFVRLPGRTVHLLSRVLISRERHDELDAKMKAIAEGVKIGHAFDADTVLGPVAMKRQLEKIEELIAVGVQKALRWPAAGSVQPIWGRGISSNRRSSPMSQPTCGSHKKRFSDRSFA